MPNPINTLQISVLKHHLVLESIKLVKCLIFSGRGCLKGATVLSLGSNGASVQELCGNAVVLEWNNGFSWLDVI